jgi:hypothetical protein
MSATELSAPLRRDLLAPVIVAPMFLVSGPELLISANRAGLMGSFPTQNARELPDLIEWLDQIRTGLAEAANPRWAASMIVHRSYDRFAAELELMQEYRPDVVVTALGPPSRVVDQVHGYGGAVFADVMSVEHARKPRRTARTGSSSSATAPAGTRVGCRRSRSSTRSAGSSTGCSWSAGRSQRAAACAPPRCSAPTSCTWVRASSPARRAWSPTVIERCSCVPTHPA